MTTPSHAGRLSALRTRPMAACLAAAIAAAAPGHGAAQVASVDQTATIVVVQNCNDSGAGSLRAAYANAIDNETIDLTQLVCSHITLGSALTDPVAATNVTLMGPGKELLTIDGDNRYRILVHRGNGGLHVDHLTLANGHYGGTRGGCIYSAGGVEATGTVVSSCVLDTAQPSAYGGAIYAKDIVSLFDSTISNSSAKGTQNLESLGGGIFSAGIIMSRSTISGNSAARGGGMIAAGLVDIEDSTISDNHARNYGGGLSILGIAFSHTIRNSTISGNSAGDDGGGIYASSANIYNSTITLNTTGSNYISGAGLLIGESILQSSIVAKNTSNAGLLEDDIVAYGTITAGNNLIMASVGPIPGASITIDPNLGPLQDNGGSTLTHALLPGSPAIGKGNNALSLRTDQRGAPFARVDGSRADIGAFEFRDTVFRNGVEPPL